MGQIYTAQCKACGFESEELYTGFGFVNAGDYYMAPAICPQCRSFGLRDQRHPPQTCRRCRSEMVFYGAPDFSRKYWTDRLQAEPVGEDTSNDITRGKHVCPQCGKVELIFEKGDMWD